MSELRLQTHDSMTIYVNGRLVAECAVGVCDGRDDLLAQVQRARRLTALPRIVRDAVARIRTIENISDHVNASSAAKQQAYSRGLLGGLDQQTTLLGDIPATPEHTAAYRAGYEYGESLSKLLRALEAPPAPPKEP